MIERTRYSTLAKPQGAWWEALGRDEKLWVGLTVLWGLAMFVMIVFIWPAVGRGQNDIRSYRVEPAAFRAKVAQFTQQYQIGEVDGVPVVAPPPGDVYLEAQVFAWRPVLQLKRGQTYRFLISSRDVQHGFSLLSKPHSLNYQILPGFVTQVDLTPEETGTFPIACNEYCGLGHHQMLGRVIVTE